MDMIHDGVVAGSNNLKFKRSRINVVWFDDDRLDERFRRSRRDFLFLG